MKKTKLLCMLIIAMLTFSMTAEVTVLPASAKVSTNKTTKKSKKKSKKKTKKSKKKAKKAKASKKTKKAKKKATSKKKTVATATKSTASVKPADVPQAVNEQVVQQAASAAPEVVAEPQAAPAPATPKAEAEPQTAPAPATPKVEAEPQAAPAPAAPKVETKAQAAPKAETEPQPTPAPAAPEVCEHNWDWKVTVQPGCTSVGYKIQSCTICGETKGSQKIIDPVGHDMETVSEEPATCQKKGKITKECTKCGKRYTESTGYSSHNYQSATPCGDEVCTVCGDVKVKTGKQGHDFCGATRVIVAPTCTADGTEEVSCIHGCGFAITRPIPATGHSYGSWTTITDPTCEAEGQETATCAVCGDTKTRSVACKGHTWATRVTKEPTCGVEGIEEDYCTVCETTGATHAIPTTGHKLGRNCAYYGCKDDNCGHVDTCVYCGAHFNIKDGTWTPKAQ